MKKEDNPANIAVVLLSLVCIFYIAESLTSLLANYYIPAQLLAFMAFAAIISAVGWHLNKKPFIWLSFIIFSIHLIKTIIDLINFQSSMTTPFIFFHIVSIIITTMGISLTTQTLKAKKSKKTKKK